MVQIISIKEKYQKEVSKELMKKFGYKSIMQVPKIEKVVINRGVGEAITNSKLMESFVDELTAIAGQKPVITRSKKSIAGFKLRENMDIGCKVTLRKERMWNFLNKLINVALPRIRDFRGVSKKSFDGRGNYTIGLKEQVVFPEINYEKVIKVSGMDITIVTSAKTDQEALVLLEMLGMPFRKA